jgi:hypothetical protein
MIKTQMNKEKYLPLLKFSGHNEVFNHSTEKRILKLINAHIN